MNHERRGHSKRMLHQSLALSQLTSDMSRKSAPAHKTKARAMQKQRQRTLPMAACSRNSGFNDSVQQEQWQSYGKEQHA